MNIYMVDTNPKVAAQCVPDDVWERRLFDAVELVSEGGAHWEGEESMFMCHHMNHAWVEWVRKDRKNWVWSMRYLTALIREVKCRGYGVVDEVVTFSDYIMSEYDGGTIRVTIPPRCVPAEFKGEKNSTGNAVLAYQRYVGKETRLHKMGGRKPDWLSATKV
jgi:hypothetical protein